MNVLHDTILPFLDEIGIAVYKEPIEGKTFLPGLKLRGGALIIDEEK